jgi:carbon-monoxide dehydrogenase medium subunit
MIPANFTYHRAHSVEQALELLSSTEDAKILAGGHSLIPALKLRLNQPGALIDIGRIKELRYINLVGDHIAIGAGATHDDIANSELLQKHIPMVPQAAELIGDVQVRNLGTLGGSLAHADPAADWPASIIASGASIVTKSKKGERVIPAADFFVGFFTTALEASEIITEIRIPVTAANAHSSYQKFMQPASRFAIVGCAAVVLVHNGVCEKVQVAFTGVADTPFRDGNVEAALVGKAPSAENIQAAANLAAQGVDLLSDNSASAEYRHHLARVYAKRALKEAIG